MSEPAATANPILLPPGEYPIDPDRELRSLVETVHKYAGEVLGELNGEVPKARYTLPALLSSCAALERHQPPVQALLRKKGDV